MAGEEVPKYRPLHQAKPSSVNRRVGLDCPDSHLGTTDRF